MTTAGTSHNRTWLRRRSNTCFGLKTLAVVRCMEISVLRDAVSCKSLRVNQCLGEGQFQSPGLKLFGFCESRRPQGIGRRLELPPRPYEGQRALGTLGLGSKTSAKPCDAGNQDTITCYAAFSYGVICRDIASSLPAVSCCHDATWRCRPTTYRVLPNPTSRGLTARQSRKNNLLISWCDKELC